MQESIESDFSKVVCLCLQIYKFTSLKECHSEVKKTQKKTLAHEKSLVLCIVPHLTICSVTAVKKIWPLFINVMEEWIWLLLRIISSLRDLPVKTGDGGPVGETDVSMHT